MKVGIHAVIVIFVNLTACPVFVKTACPVFVKKIRRKDTSDTLEHPLPEGQLLIAALKH